MAPVRCVRKAVPPHALALVDIHDIPTMAVQEITELFEKVIKPAHLEWRVAGDGLDFFVYVVDTSTLWMQAGGVAYQEAQTAIDLATQVGYFKRAPNPVTHAAATIVSASRAKAKFGQGPLLVALTSTLLHISQTEVYAAALQQAGSARGHWLYLVYQLGDGQSFVGRLHFVPLQGEPQVLPAQAIKQMTHDLVMSDVGVQGKGVNETLEQHGGAMLHESLANEVQRIRTRTLH